MNLTDDQKATIAQWIAKGASLSDLQKRLKEEFQISITYLEARLLADDLKLAFPEPPEPEKKPEPEPEPEPELPPGGVAVSIDQITRPGSMISGKVTFSDGEKAEWYLDQAGRLGLNPTTPGYRPAQEDVIAFQEELQRQARGQGL